MNYFQLTFMTKSISFTNLHKKVPLYLSVVTIFTIPAVLNYAADSFIDSVILYP